MRTPPERAVNEKTREAQWGEWMSALVRSAADAVVGVAVDRTIASFNPAAERLYGYAAAEVLGRRIAVLAPASHRVDQDMLLSRALAGESVLGARGEGLRKDETIVPISLSASGIRDRREMVIGAGLIVRDTTDRIRFERELKFFADHDPLTGMLNRRRFIDELTGHVAFVQRYAQEPGVLLIGDLDNFKQVNDTLGHKAGDELIKAVAHQLSGRLRETDAIGRLGGDEFAVLLPRASTAQAADVAEVLRAAVRDLELHRNGHRLRTSMSIGVAPIHSELTAEDTLAAADIAMYDAKRTGRNRISLASPVPPSDEARPDLGWSERLRMALAEDRFEIHTQPIYPLRAGGVVGYELLVRLRERGALIGPEVFIPTAERLGLVEEIDRHVLAQAIDLLAGDRDGHVAYHVNVSALSIANPQLLRFVATETAAAAADPARLTIEVAETAAFIDLDAVQHFALGLERLGCKLALDDFGSGFGSFAYLKFVPVSALKIDGGLIAGMAGSDDDRLIVKAIVDIAHGKGIETIAEQVGTEDTRQLLIDLGADYGQGDLYGEPSALGLSVGRSSAQGSG